MNRLNFAGIIFTAFYLFTAVTGQTLEINGQCRAVKDKNKSDECVNYVKNLASELKNNWPENISSGAFIIEDPGFKIFDNLLQYVKNIYGEKGIYSEVMISLRSAYPRKSTHLNDFYLYNKYATKSLLGAIKKEPKYVHYGIDVEKDTKMPPGKHHILFGKVGQVTGFDKKTRDLIYIKPEEHGLQAGRGFGGHVVDLIKSKLKKSGSLATERKERIPAQFMKPFLAIIKNHKQNYSDYKKQAKAEGIQAIISILTKLSQETINDKLRRDMITLNQNILKQYPDDYFTRFGNEIILLKKQ